MKYSVCVDSLYFGQPTEQFLIGMQEAADAGFKAIEFWTWWEKDTDAIARKAKELDLDIAAICTKFISLGDASKRGEYLEALKASIAEAKKLSCSTIISQGGFMNGETDAEFRSSLIEGLKEAAPMLEDSGITLVLEPLNTRVDHPGYWLQSSDQTFPIIDEINSPAVKVLFDIYHQQITEGNIINNIREHIADIRHFHSAGNPGRHEIISGEVNYPEVFRAIDALPYEGYIGLEYIPSLPVKEGLEKTVEYLRKNNVF